MKTVFANAVYDFHLTPVRIADRFYVSPSPPPPPPFKAKAKQNNKKKTIRRRINKSKLSENQKLKFLPSFLEKEGKRLSLYSCGLG